VSADAARLCVAGHGESEEVVRVGDGLAGDGADGGPCASDVEACVVVGSAGAGLLPDAAEAWVDAVFLREVLDACGRERFEVLLDDGAVGDGVCAVEDLPALEEEGGAFDVVVLEFAVLDVEGVCEGVREVVVGEPVGEGVDIGAEVEVVDLVVEVGCEVPDEDMEEAAVFGEADGDFLADDEVLEASFAEFHGAVDGVVVGDGEEVHAASFGEVVGLFGCGVALGHAGKRADDAVDGFRGGVGVAVEVGACERAEGVEFAEFAGFGRVVVLVDERAGVFEVGGVKAGGSRGRVGGPATRPEHERRDARRSGPSVALGFHRDLRCELSGLAGGGGRGRAGAGGGACLERWWLGVCRPRPREGYRVNGDAPRRGGWCGD